MDIFFVKRTHTAAVFPAALLAFMGWCMVVSLQGCNPEKPSPDAADPSASVTQRLADLAPAADIGHRGTGKTRPGHPFPENSLSSFLEAMAQNADGIELDLELTADGRLVVMHDDTLDRTTNCTGCVNRMPLAEIRECRLLAGSGLPTEEHPPTLEEVYAALPPGTLVNAELKVFGAECLTEASGASQLARAAVREVHRLGETGRTFFSSFDEEAAGAVKREDPSVYSALLLNRKRSVAWEPSLDRAIDLGLDAIHPHYLMPRAGIRAALEAGLQVNVYTVNGRVWMNLMLDAGVTSIITDLPGPLRIEI